MTPTKLAALRMLDPNTLSELVQRTTGQPELRVSEFTVKTLSNKGVMNPEGLFLFSGRGVGSGVVVPWSLVLKLLNRPGEAQAPHAAFYWQRESLAWRSGLLTSLPREVSIPEYYAVEEHGDQTWIWMEYVAETVDPQWTLNQYAQAARKLGRLNGTYLTGTPLPDHPWLVRELARQWSGMLSPEGAWESGVVRTYFPPALRERAMALWADREEFYRVLNTLPQVFSHFDFQRRNLLIRGEDVVAVDWAFCGIGPVGGDLYSLVGATCLLREWNVSHIRDLEKTVFSAYLMGLNDTGWTGDPRMVRLAYTAWMGLFCLTAVRLTEYWLQDDRQAQAVTAFNGTPEEIASTWAALCVYGLDLADEAKKLGMVAE